MKQITLTQKVRKMVNNPDLLKLLTTLKTNWYMDWILGNFQPYEDKISEFVLSKYPDITFRGATQEPFGFIFTYEQYEVSVFVNITENKIGLVGGIKKRT